MKHWLRRLRPSTLWRASRLSRNQRPLTVQLLLRLASGYKVDLDELQGESAGTARQLAGIIASGGRRERLRALRTPTLVIHGDRDPLVPIDCGIDVARSVPAARMVTIEGMGHALPRRTWQPIVDAIAEHVCNG